jgi:DnaA family protein
MPTTEQLLLNLQPRPDARLSDFAAPAYAGILAAVRAALDTPGGLLYLWGGRGSGRSHLLAAVCAEAEQRGLPSLLLPLGELVSEAPDLLDGLESQGLIACDDMQALAGHSAWEEGMFHLFNRARAAGVHLVFSADAPAADTGLRLPDLVSRLALAPAWPLPLPDDASRQALVMAAAGRRGLIVEPEVARYLVLRAPREPGGLLGLLERLDRGAMVAGRRLTIPFVRQVLESGRQG